MKKEDKNKISHRSKALALMKEYFTNNPQVLQGSSAAAPSNPNTRKMLEKDE
jgi:hypothetical protein